MPTSPIPSPGLFTFWTNRPLPALRAALARFVASPGAPVAQRPDLRAQATPQAQRGPSAATWTPAPGYSGGRHHHHPSPQPPDPSPHVTLTTPPRRQVGESVGERGERSRAVNSPLTKRGIVP